VKRSFAVANIRCEGCANSIKKALAPHFGEVEVDLSKMPRIVTVDLQNEADVDRFKEILIRLGYPLVDSGLSTAASIGAKARSLVSCTVGKLTLEKGE
jgi:copper chaperone CopZ